MNILFYCFYPFVLMLQTYLIATININMSAVVKLSIIVIGNTYTFVLGVFLIDVVCISPKVQLV